MAKVDLDALHDPTRSVTLLDPRSTGMWLTLGSAIFVIAGIIMLRSGAPDDQLGGWLATGFFGLCLVVGLLKLFGPQDSLSLDQFGFTYTNLGKPHRIEWNSLTGFGIITVGAAIGGRKMTSFNYAYDQRPPGSDLARDLSGFDDALPVSYGVKPEILAQAMQKRLEASRG